MLRFILLSSLAPVALSYTRRKTFPYVPKELANLVPRRFLPFFPSGWMSSQLKNVCRVPRDTVAQSRYLSLFRYVQHLHWGKFVLSGASFKENKRRTDSTDLPYDRASEYCCPYSPLSCTLVRQNSLVVEGSTQADDPRWAKAMPHPRHPHC